MTILARIRHWKKETYRRRGWNIGFTEFNEETIFKPFRIAWLEHGERESWFADPFILSDDGISLEVLVEHYRYDEKRGRLARLSIERTDRCYRLRSITPLLSGETHFSFPNFYRDGDRIYVFPENWQRGTLPLYELSDEATRLERVGTLCDRPCVDAVITEAFGRPRLLATREDDDPSGSTLDIYCADDDDWRGPYTLESCYVFADRVARGAGRCFFIGSRLVRVAQDNNGIYGGGLVFFEMTKTENGFDFQEIARHRPRGARYNLGMHTFNVHAGIAVVDGRGYAHPLRRAIYRLKVALGRGKRVGDRNTRTSVT